MSIDSLSWIHSTQHQRENLSPWIYLDKRHYKRVFDRLAYIYILIFLYGIVSSILYLENGQTTIGEYCSKQLHRFEMIVSEMALTTLFYFISILLNLIQTLNRSSNLFKSYEIIKPPLVFYTFHWHIYGNFQELKFWEMSSDL